MNPIKYDVIEYNDEIEYNNGVIIILQPGWYTFNANIRGSNANDSNKFISVVIVIDNVRKVHAKRYLQPVQVGSNLLMFF